MSVPRQPARQALGSQWGAPLLLAALSVSLVAQGAFYLRVQLWVAVLLATALLALPGVHRLARADRPVALAVAGLAGWAVIDAALHSDPRAAVPYLALLVGLLAVFLACGRLNAGARDLVLTGLIGCGILVAAARLAGTGAALATVDLAGPGAVAGVVDPDLSERHGGHPGDAGALTLACLTEAPRSTRLALSTTVLLTGLIATLSRAGLMAVVAGLLVLAAARGPKALTRSAWGPALGAAVAALGLVPTMTAGSPRPRPCSPSPPASRSAPAR